MYYVRVVISVWLLGRCIYVHNHKQILLLWGGPKSYFDIDFDS